MRITKEEPTTKAVLDDVICNRCGKSCKAGGNDLNNIYFAKCVARGGFGSPCLVDGYEYTFEVCEGCFIDIAKAFKHPPTVRDLGLFGESDSPPEITWEETIREDKTDGE